MVTKLIDAWHHWTDVTVPKAPIHATSVCHHQPQTQIRNMKKEFCVVLKKAKKEKKTKWICADCRGTIQTLKLTMLCFAFSFK